MINIVLYILDVLHVGFAIVSQGMGGYSIGDLEN